MALESGVQHINDLVPSNPTDGDALAQGDNHIRNIKAALKNTFPNISNTSDVTAQDLQKLHHITVGSAQINHLEGVNGNVQQNIVNLINNKLHKNDFNRASILDMLRYVDGAGSGLDADRLDGQHMSFYRNASNLNAGKISPFRLDRASAAEAQAGNDGQKVMTPLRTQNAMEEYVPRVANGSRLFTTNGTWTVPQGVSKAIIIAVGGGGGGDDDRPDDKAYPGGVQYNEVSVGPGQNVPIVVGAGGNRDQDGGDSTAGPLLAAGGATADSLPGDGRRNTYNLSYGGKPVRHKDFGRLLSSIPMDFEQHDKLSRCMFQTDSPRTGDDSGASYGPLSNYFPGTPGAPGSNGGVAGAVFIFYFHT